MLQIEIHFQNHKICELRKNKTAQFENKDFLKLNVPLRIEIAKILF